MARKVPMIRRLLIIPAIAMLLLAAIAPDAFSKDILAQAPPLTFPPAPDPPPDRLVFPPQENPYFPLRADGQQFVLNEDISVNMTDPLNRYYFNPHWRAEDWAPYQNWWIVEHACRLMSTWEEYDNFSVFKFLTPTNRIHKWFEKYSGYGP